MAPEVGLAGQFCLKMETTCERIDQFSHIRDHIFNRCENVSARPRSGAMTTKTKTNPFVPYGTMDI